MRSGLAMAPPLLIRSAASSTGAAAASVGKADPDGCRGGWPSIYIC
jgi:hypothetical protein